MGSKFRLGACLSAAGLAMLLAGDELAAQAPFSGLCQTQNGICAVEPGPVGAFCRCGNGDLGRFIFPPPNWNNACGTRYGVCRMANYAPVGSRCNCGNAPGQIIPR